MKGTFFQKPFEFKLNVEGETWRQAQGVSGVLTVKNQGSSPVSVEGTRVHLAYGQLRKVRAKSPGSFQILNTATLTGSTSLDPQKEVQLSWQFPTDLNSPISDTGASLFLLYGQAPETDKLGQLQLTFHPSEIIQEFLNAITVQFRFVQKTIRSSKGWVQVKLAPPTAKAFAMLEHLNLSFHFDGDTLEVEYEFNIKKIEAGVAGMNVLKAKKATNQAFTAAQYRLPSGRLNHEIMEAGIREALSLIATLDAKTAF